MKLFSGLCAAFLLVLFNSTTYAETYYFHNDHLGTPQALIDKDQNVVWQAEYDPFGKATETVSEVEQNLRSPGQYLDRESGLHYNYFRTYDPQTGRYTQSDPIGLRGGINTYGYAYQNPVSNFDPDGRLVWFGVPAAYWAAGAASTTAAVWWATNNPWAVNPSQFSNSVYNNKGSIQNEKRPQNCPSGTLDIDKAKGRYGWDKDKLHEVKKGAHGQGVSGKSWTGIAPDGTVGINEGAQWTPVGQWEERF